MVYKLYHSSSEVVVLIVVRVKCKVVVYKVPGSSSSGHVCVVCVCVCVCVWFRIFLEDLYNLAWSSGPRVVRIADYVA